MGLANETLLLSEFQPTPQLTAAAMTAAVADTKIPVTFPNTFKGPNRFQTHASVLHLVVVCCIMPSEREVS